MDNHSQENAAERRVYHRYDCDFPITITGIPDGQLSCRSINISLSGLQLHGDRFTVTRFAPKAEHTTPDRSPSVGLCFTLPFRKKEPVDVRVSCKVIVIRRVAEQEYHVGLQYQFFEGRDYDQLEAYVHEIDH